MHRLLTKERRLFLALLVFRLVNALFIQTAFVPDEMWQSIEVAHRWVFGYGQLTWEWQPETAIRSSLYPALIATPYYVSKLFAIDTKAFIVLVPYLFHAIMAAITDIRIYRLAKLLAGADVAKWTLFHQLCNWFTCFCSPRPLANCLEWFLTTVALSYYPWHLLIQWPFGTVKTFAPHSIKTTDSPRLFMALAVACVLMRPTAAIIWVPMCALHLYLLALIRWRSGTRQDRFWWTLGWYILISLLGVLLSLSFDRLFYGQWTISQWNFLRFNVILGGSEMYGTHPWHWYITQGVPVLLTTQVPFFLVGVLSLKRHTLVGTDDQGRRNLSKIDSLLIMNRSHTILIGIIVWTILCYSLLAHKEFRFVFPLVPIMMYFCGHVTASILKGLTLRSYKFRSRLLILFLIGTHIPVTVYTSIIHQRGGLDVIAAMNNRLSTMIDRINERSPSFNGAWLSYSVLSLMPCHSIPPISYIHQNITLRQLACDPDLTGWFTKEFNVPYVNEEELFYDDPVTWLKSEYGHLAVPAKRPDCILAFDHLFDTFPSVRDLILNEWNYTVFGRFFHAHFPTHSRHSTYMNAFCLADTSTI